MRTNPRVFARRIAQAGTAVVLVAGGVAVAAGPAHAVVPTVTSVFTPGAGPTRVVTAGTTILITGTGFDGMVDNSADPACSVTPVASSRCSQVRFNGVSADANATGYTLADRYVVASDTQIYVTVPEIAAVAPAVGAPAAGTGSVRIVVVNTAIGGSSSLASAPGVTTATEVFYRHPLVASSQDATVVANPFGGATLAVDVTNVATLTSGPSGTFTAEKITAYFVRLVDGSPTVSATSVTFNDGDTVDVEVPPGTPAGDFVGVMLVHDGILGTADHDSMKYSAVISEVATCEAFVVPVETTPVCAGPPHTAASPAYTRLTGKGLAGATNFRFDGSDGVTDEDCSVVSDTVAYCAVEVTTAPSFPVVAVTFTPGDPIGPGTTPSAGGVGAGSIFGFYD